MDDSLESTRYGSRFEVVLEDQGIQGRVDSVAPALVRVQRWRRDAASEEVARLETDEGSLRVRVGPDGLAPDRIEPDTVGRGLRAALLEVPEVAGEGDGAGALRTILVGTEDGSHQGLIPENVFQAMARGEILPLILAAILGGLVLVSMGEEAAPAASPDSFPSSSPWGATRRRCPWASPPKPWWCSPSGPPWPPSAPPRSRRRGS